MNINGIYSVRGWSHLNKNTKIALCHTCKRRTACLLVVGLLHIVNVLCKLQLRILSFAMK